MTWAIPAPTKPQRDAIMRAGLNPFAWLVLQEKKHHLVIRHRVTGEIKLISREEPT